MADLQGNGWSKWEKHVLLELERLNNCHGDVSQKLDQLMKEVSALRVKAGVWGLFAGAAPIALVLLVAAIKIYILDGG